MDEVAKLLTARTDAIVAVIGSEQAVSKYIGETEKSLAAAFEDAGRAGSLLVLDESDDLFGKTEGHDGPIVLTARSLDAIPPGLRDRLDLVKTVVAGFDVAAEAYDSFMGRFSTQLSAQFADLAGVQEGQRALDVGCGPGALTGELVHRLGAANVAAADPSEPFVAAARERHPGVDVRLAPAEKLPFEDDFFDAALAQLVVHFMQDAVAGLRELGRVSRGVVAASVWDLAGGRAPLSPFWIAAQKLDPEAEDEAKLAGARQGHLADLFREAGLTEVEEAELTSSVTYESFDDWWLPYTKGVGPAGQYTVSLDERARERLREACRAALPEPPFTIEAVAWAVRGSA